MGALRTTLGPALVLFACLFASQAALLVLSPTLRDVAREFGISTSAAGQLRTVSGAVGGITAVLLALAPRRPSLRTLLSGGLVLVAAGSGASAAAPSFAALTAAQGVVGMGIGVLVAIGIAAAGQWSPAEERPRTLAWAIAGMPAAWVLGMPVVGLTAAVDWRLAWLALPAATSLITLALVRLAPADAPSVRAPGATGAWRRPEVARFTAGELLANAAWASVLTYAGSLLFESYGASRATVTAGLALIAAAMVPGTFLGRRTAARATPALLIWLTIAQAAAVTALGLARGGTGMSLGVLSLMAFVNGWRSVTAGGLGMDAAPDDPVAVMSLRAAANQFGYLIGAAAGGIALATGGFAALSGALAVLFVLGALLHVAPVRQARPAVVAGGAAVG